jgi:hypothetical protein
LEQEIKVEKYLELKKQTSGRISAKKLLKMD